MPIYSPVLGLVHYVSHVGDADAMTIVRCDLLDQLEQFFPATATKRELRARYRTARKAFDSMDPAWLTDILGLDTDEVDRIVPWLVRLKTDICDVLDLGTIVGLPLKVQAVIGPEAVDWAISDNTIHCYLYANGSVVHDDNKHRHGEIPELAWGLPAGFVGNEGW